MRAVFVELPAFERHRSAYLSDVAFAALQALLMRDPAAGDTIPATGGLRKLRFGDVRRGKGKRGGLRVIYYWWSSGWQYWLFAVYDKGEADDLTPSQRREFRTMLKTELAARRRQ